LPKNSMTEQEDDEKGQVSHVFIFFDLNMKAWLTG